MNTTLKTQRLTMSAVMIALSATLAIVCALIPFLNLPFGGGFTIASMLPIVLISYMYGLKWGFFVSGTYALLQMLMDKYTFAHVENSWVKLCYFYETIDENWVGTTGVEA